jgi:basic membrane lipoprotein Med (substrate-binding protein (PBP1-ABC) superfamily)
MSRNKTLATPTFIAIACLGLALAGGAPAAEDAPAKVKAAFALLWTIDDQGWTTAHYHGIEHLKETLGDKVEISYTEKVLAADAERVFRNYAQQGYDIVFGTTFEHMDPLLNVAKDYPDIVFEHCSGFKTAPNMGNYFARMYQGEYLAGYMAGLMGFRNVGTVATNPIPEPIRGINAFTIGLRRGLGEAGHEVGVDEKVNTVVWLKAWRDPINETTLAETLVARKHDLIRQMADTPDSSVASCAAGVPAIGYGEDAARYGADCALVSTVWNWGPIYVDKVRQVLNGTWKSTAYWGGFEKNNIVLSDFHASVPEAVRRKVLAEKEKLEAGRDDIFSGPLYDQEGRLVIPEGQRASDKDLLSMRWLVRGVSGSIPK